MLVAKGSLLAALSLSVAWAAVTPDRKNVTCGTCHRAEAASQPTTSMGIGMEIPPHQASLQAHPKMTFEFQGYKYAVERKGDLSYYTVSDAKDSITLPIQYAFGAHMQTYVFMYQGRYFESMVSYYTTIDNLHVTIGDERMQPKTLVEALGKEYNEAGISRCFGCHSSGSVTGTKVHLDTLRPGLDCEHCHTGANGHMESLAQGKPGTFPQKLSDTAAEDMANFCGTCHRTWESAVRLRLWGPVNVRFQPYRLSLSKCFVGNDKRIACTACHNPHEELVRDNPKFYDSKCLACHASKDTPATTSASAAAHGNPVAGAMQKACPVSPQNCTSCHMPKVELPGGHSLFNDHYIRVVRSGEDYPN